ncbi:MAG: hypothetical protein R6U11_04605 [Bacteroidales bacterium]
MKFTTGQGHDIEYRTLTWQERKEVSKLTAKAVSDVGSYVEAVHLCCEYGIETVDGKPISQEIFDNELNNIDEINEIGKKIREASFADKKK